MNGIGKMSSFNPNWASKPGDTILDILHERNISLAEFALLMNSNENEIKALINADIKINKKIAEQLHNIFGASVEFWIRREKQYRNQLKKLNLKYGSTIKICN